MRETLSTPENSSEKFKEVLLEIKEPDGIHQLEIIFDETDAKLVAAYNAAIDEICNGQRHLGCFHQTGRENKPGYHTWEVLGSQNDAKKLLDLFPSIHKKAEELYLKFSE